MSDINLYDILRNCSFRAVKIRLNEGNRETANNFWSCGLNVQDPKKAKNQEQE